MTETVHCKKFQNTNLGRNYVLKVIGNYILEKMYTLLGRAYVLVT